ncbi:MAG TPA: hydrolase [Nitrospiria bacterium]|nr:hydrolase [Nitrospiria bacterium]
MARSRSPEAFQPPWWLRNRHAQTIWRRVAGSTPRVDYRRERVDTPDGDFIDLDWLDGPTSDRDTPLLVVLHGLEGSSRAKYVLGLLSIASASGWNGVAVNFRSCSGELNRLARFYHSGETEDLNWVISLLIARSPHRPLAIVGYSLGGNVLLKWLGERGDTTPEPVRAAVAVSVPYDLGVAAHRVDHGFGRVYGQVFLRTLKTKALAKAERFPGLVDEGRVRRLSRFAAFDEHVTAPIHGFAGARDYWTRSSCVPWLDRICRPTLMISAADDPFLPSAYWPREAVARSSWLETAFSERGGHVGFVQGPWPWTPLYWVDQRAAAFLETIRSKEGF